MATTASPALDIDSEDKISPGQVARFQKDGCIKLKPRRLHAVARQSIPLAGGELTRRD